jgi:hypothetical protein
VSKGATPALSSLEDHFAQEKRWWLRLSEKNGKVNEMPCHHKLETYRDAYIQATGIEGDAPRGRTQSAEALGVAERRRFT